MAQTPKRMYEGMFLVDAATATADWDGTVGTIHNVFNRAQADIVSLQKWDERRLCYDIKGHKRGTYILTYFNADPERIGGIERDVQLNETLLRVLVLRADEIPAEKRDEPTPAMVAEQQEAERGEAEGAKAKESGAPAEEDKKAEPVVTAEPADPAEAEPVSEVAPPAEPTDSAEQAPQ